MLVTFTLTPPGLSVARYLRPCGRFLPELRSPEIRKRLAKEPTPSPKTTRPVLREFVGAASLQDCLALAHQL